MKKILLAFTLIFNLNLFSYDDWKGSVDTAEACLRIILNEPVSGYKFSAKEVTKTKRLEAFAALMNVEMRYPGLLKGKLDPGFEWGQYKEVQELFKKLEVIYDFWYEAGSPSNH